MILHTLLIGAACVYGLASLFVFGLLMGACLLAKRPMPSPENQAVKVESVKYQPETHRIKPFVKPAEIAA